MKIINLFILKKWLAYFFLALSSLYLLITIASFVSELLRGQATLYYIFLHHIVESPKWIGKILPISCLMASLFSLNHLRQTNELVAILSSGISKSHIILSVATIGLIISFLHFGINSYVTPFAISQKPYILKGNEKKFRTNKKVGKHLQSLEDGSIWFKTKDYFIKIAAFDKHNDELKKLQLYYYESGTSNILSIVKAENATYESGNRWKLYNGITYNQTSDESFSTSTKFEEKDILLTEKPGDFKNFELDVRTLNIQKLYKYIHNIKKMGILVNEYLIYFYEMFSNAILCLLFSFIPLVILNNPHRRTSSVSKNMILIVLFTLMYWTTHSFALSLGINKKIPPVASSFLLPAIIIIFTLTNFKRSFNRA